MAFLRRTLGILAALAVLPVVPLSGAERPLVTSEYAVKAAFLYNFAKFVEWPADAFRGPLDPVTLCVLGEDPFGAELDRTVDGKTVAGRPIVIRRLAKLAGPAECRILFVSASESPRFGQILATAGSRAMLTVGEDETFARAGGIISFVVRQDRVRFQIARAAAARAGLTISSRLLELAETVR